jgi:hypothetical protein
MSKLMDGEYCVLMETNAKESECWYYFLRVQGNEESLKHLFDELESIDWCIDEDISMFTLDLDRPVSAQTAKQMTRLQLNTCLFHRKFDGHLKKINFGLKKKDSTEKKMGKVFDLLGYGGIDEYISDEDEDSIIEDGSYISSSDEESESSSDEEETKNCSLPPMLM